MDNNFMELGEALTTVWELANQNIDELQHEIAKLHYLINENLRN